MIIVYFIPDDYPGELYRTLHHTDASEGLLNLMKY